MIFFRLLFVLLCLFSKNASAESEPQVFRLELRTVTFAPDNDKVNVKIKGHTSDQLKIYLTEVEVQTSANTLKTLSSKIETNLGIKAEKNHLLIPLDPDGNFDLSLKLPKSLVKLKFDAEHVSGAVLGSHTLSFGVMNVAQTFNLNMQRDFSFETAVVAEQKAQPEIVPEVKPNPDYTKLGFWIWAGTGVSYTHYQQTVGTIGKFNDTNVAVPSVVAEVGYKHKSGFGGLASYKSTPGEAQLANTNILGIKYVWTTLSLEGFYEKEATSQFLGGEFFYGGLLGIQDHAFPYFHIEDVGELSVQNVKMQTASLGFQTRLQNGKFGYLWSMRYQYPITINTSGVSNFDIEPKFAFDGSIGMTYNLSERWKLGLFWYGQWHEYDLGYRVNTTSYSGSQSLFYSNTDFRLGVEF